MLNSSSSASRSCSRRLWLGLDHFEHGADIVLDAQPAEDRGFLRQIADAEARALIHRQRGHIEAVEFDASVVGLDQTGDHVEHRGLAGAVRAEQADRLALAHVKAHALDHLAADEGLFHAVHGKKALAVAQRRAIAVGAAARPRRGRCPLVGAANRLALPPRHGRRRCCRGQVARRGGRRSGWRRRRPGRACSRARRRCPPTRSAMSR